MSNDDHGIHGSIAGLSPSGGDAWHSVFSSEADPGWAEFDSIAVSTGGSLLAGGWTQTALGGKAFVARYSATWPATATLDYVSPGSATSDDECRAVAIGASGMYAVEQESGERHVIELPNGSYDYRTDTPMNLLGIVVATVTATLVVAIIGVGSRLVLTRTRTRRFQPISLRL
jgi:hypothetical protein